MKKLTLICFVAFFAFLCCGSVLNAAAEPKAVSPADESGAGPDHGADSGISTETNADRDDPGELKRFDESAGDENDKKEFASVRKKRNPFVFKVGISIGGMGYGILGPRQLRDHFYQFRYEEQSFMAGFRGGIEALFLPHKRHCISVGVFYEQRRVQLKIGDGSLSRLLFPGLTPLLVYYLPLARYVDKSNVDTNYITLPVGYRYFVMDELYIGFSLDVAVLFQAKANYSVIGYTLSVNYMRYMQSIDFGGRALVGFTMNRVFIEIGIGCGFLDIDRLPGERHTIYVTGMVGYRI